MANVIEAMIGGAQQQIPVETLTYRAINSAKGVLLAYVISPVEASVVVQKSPEFATNKKLLISFSPESQINFLGKTNLIAMPRQVIMSFTYRNIPFIETKLISQLISHELNTAKIYSYQLPETEFKRIETQNCKNTSNEETIAKVYAIFGVEEITIPESSTREVNFKSNTLNNHLKKNRQNSQKIDKFGAIITYENAVQPIVSGVIEWLGANESYKLQLHTVYGDESRKQHPSISRLEKIKELDGKKEFYVAIGHRANAEVDPFLSKTLRKPVGDIISDAEFRLGSIFRKLKVDLRDMRKKIIDEAGGLVLKAVILLSIVLGIFMVTSTWYRTRKKGGQRRLKKSTSRKIRPGIKQAVHRRSIVH